LCAKCGLPFPNRAWVEGQLKNLSGRKYCLSCSPWGKHNTTQIHLTQDRNPQRICRVCGKGFVYEGKKKNPKDHRKNMCKSCRTTIGVQKKKMRSLEYKGGKCIRCGYSKFPDALCFHHRERHFKTSMISRYLHYSWERLRVELDKCDLLCLNCHAEVHAESSDAGIRKGQGDQGRTKPT
jgi:hypothetical protein